jgi:hypothetical protein
MRTAANSNERECEREYLIYEIRSRVKEYADISCFRLFGWGRLKRESLEIIEAAALDVDAGSRQDPGIIAKLIAAQGIQTKIALTELGWN